MYTNGNAGLIQYQTVYVTIDTDEAFVLCIALHNVIHPLAWVCTHAYMHIYQLWGIHVYASLTLNAVLHTYYNVYTGPCIYMCMHTHSS